MAYGAIRKTNFLNQKTAERTAEVSGYTNYSRQTGEKEIFITFPVQCPYVGTHIVVVTGSLYFFMRTDIKVEK